MVKQNFYNKNNTLENELIEVSRFEKLLKPRKSAAPQQIS